MNIHLASDGGVVQVPHALSDYDSLEGVYADISAATGIVSGNVLLFTEDGRELKQEVLEELWERGGGQGAGQSSPVRQVVYLFNRETFFSEPEHWASQLREEVVLPPSLDLSTHLDVNRAQEPFEAAYDHLLHLQSLFKVQAHALQIAYANLSFHLQPILDAFRDFTGRADEQLEQHEKLLRGYEVDMAMLPKVVVHESLFRRRDRDGDEGKRKTLVDWIHTKKMEQVRDWCQTAHVDYVNRYNTVAAEMEELALQSEADRNQAEHRIIGVEGEFADALGRIELASQQVEALTQTDQETFEENLAALDQAMREDLGTITQFKNDFTLELHVHLRRIAEFQVRITKFTKPMTELDLDLRQKNAFPHLERLHNLPFAYAANVIEIVQRKEFSTSLVEWAARISKAVNTFLATEVKRRQRHKSDNQLPWEITVLEESQTPRVDIKVGGGDDALRAVGLGRNDIDDLLKWVDQLEEDPDFMAIDPNDNPVPALGKQITHLLNTLDSLTGELDKALENAVTTASSDANEVERLRNGNAEYERRLAEMEEAHQAQLRELEERYEQRVDILQTRQGELQEELVRLRTDLSEEMNVRQQVSNDLEEKMRECDDRAREQDEQSDFIIALQADMGQEKDRATDLGVRLQEALLDVDGLRSAEQALVVQIRESQEERTRILTDLGEAQLMSQNYESELAGTKAELDATAVQLVQAQLDRDQALRNQSAEAERLMRDRIAEADGDRAVLEHQNLTLTKELEDSRSGVSKKVDELKNSYIRREDGLKAELSFTKAQLREVQRRETVLSDELAMAKDSAAALQNKESHNTELTKDAVVLAGKYHDACQRVMSAIAASTTISGSISLPARAKTPPVATMSTASADLKDSTVLVRSLETASSFDLEAFADAVQRTINLARKLSKSCKQYRELSRNKITISSFGKGDLVLFLPTRNAAVKAWAAFNISAPHHFLSVTDMIQQQLVGKDYYLARITSTDEAVVNGDSPSTNPYGLAEGLRYYSHHVEEWMPTAPRQPRRSQSANASATQNNNAESNTISPISMRARAQSSFLPQYPKPDDDSSAPPPSPPARLSPPHAPTPTRTSPVPRMTSASPIPEASASSEARNGSPAPNPVSTRSPPPQPLRAIHAQSPPPPPSSPTSPMNVRVNPPTAATRSHRSSLASTSSPPPRDGVPFTPNSFGRPSSVASSTSSHPRGLPIPTGTGGTKGAPAAPVATSVEGSPSHPSSSFGESGQRITRQGSVGSLKAKAAKTEGGDLFKPSPLRETENASGSASGFLSGLSLTRKRNSVSSTVASPTALDMLKRIDGGSGSG